MRCEDFERRMQELLDARRAATRDHLLQQHARQCRCCRETLQAQELVLNVLAARREPRARVGGRRLMFARRRAAYAALLTAAALILLALLPLRNVPPSHSKTEQAERSVPQSSADETASQGSAAPTDAEVPSLPLADDPLSAQPYRLLQELTEQMQRFSHEPPETVQQLAGGLRPVTHSVSTAFETLKQTIPGRRPTEGPPPQPQASWLELPSPALPS